MDEPTGTKVCRMCGGDKSVDEFGKDSGGRTRPNCNVCRLARRRRLYAMSEVEREAEREVERDLRREAGRLTEKVCSKCGALKGAAEFQVRHDRAGGLLSACRECIAQQRSLYRQRNREALNAKSKAWREANPELYREICARYRRDNPEVIAQRDRERYDREKNTERVRAFRDAHPEYVAEYRRKNAAKFAKYARDYRDRYPELAAARDARRRGVVAEGRDIDLSKLWTGLCGICLGPLDGELHYPDLMSKSIDHIVPIALGGLHTQDNLQWAHLVCNMRKGVRTD